MARDATPRRSLVGRLLLAAPFWALLTYTATAMVGSMVHALFFSAPKAAEAGPVRVVAYCFHHMTDLHDALRDRMLRATREADLQGHAPLPHERWWAEYRALAPLCGDRKRYAELASAHRMLGDLATQRIVQDRSHGDPQSAFAQHMASAVSRIDEPPDSRP